MLDIKKKLSFSLIDPKAYAHNIHTCTHTRSALNNHIKRTRRRPSPWWWWSRLGCLYLMTFVLLFPLFNIQAFAPWNMDAVCKEERPTFHCHMRMDRKINWWWVFQKVTWKGNISWLFICQFFYFLICHLNSNQCRKLRGKCVRGMF